MKQTSIEWLISKLPMVNENDPYLSEIIEQAKEMEKQQIVDAYEEGYFDEMSSEQYYKETFKK